MDKKTIAYIVVHGFAARMVMQTNLLGKLVDAGCRVVLITPDGSDQTLKEYSDDQGIELFEFNTRSGFWNSQYQNARKYFLEDIRQNTALWEKHVWATRYNRSRNPWSHIRPRLLYAAHRMVRLFPSLRKWYKKREQKHLNSKEADQLIGLIRPDLLVSTYPVSFQEAMLMQSAGKQGVKTVIHLLSWDNITCKGHFPCLADEYIVWGNIMKEELIQYYSIPEKNIHVCGVPHFDLHMETRKNPAPGPFLEKLGLDPGRRYLFFGMSSPRFAPKEIDIVEWLAGEIEADRYGKEMQLIIRPHPQNVSGYMADGSWLNRLNRLKSSRVAIDIPDLEASRMPWSMKRGDMVRMSNLLAGSAVCLNSGSTLSIDGLAVGVPVILTSFDGQWQLPYWRSARRLIDYPHLQKLVALGGVGVVRNYEQLMNGILEVLQPSQSLLNKMTSTLSEECQFAITPATQQVVHQLVNKINKQVFDVI